MKAMIFAAGEGRRMRPLTLSTPKPLLRVKGKPLIEYHLEALRASGFRDLVINVAYLGDQIVDWLEDGRRFGLSIQYSREPEPLETGGGIRQALPLLGEDPFVLLNADIWCDYKLDKLRSAQVAEGGAHLVLVPPPEYKSSGDFNLEQGHISAFGPDWTFSGISLVHPDFIRLYPRARSKFPLVEVYRWGVERGLLSGEIHRGNWLDVGTPERLAKLNS